MVQTLHDYEVVCPAYTLFTQGAPCHRCVGSSVIDAVRHRCFKNSVAASSLGALEAGLARRRGTFNRIDYFVAPSRFMASVVEAAGIRPERVRYLPYFLPEAELADRPGGAERPPSFFFGGRLDETKGVQELLAAFDRVPGPATLRIAGWGPLEGAVVAAAARNDRIAFLGALPRADVLNELARSRALVLPSIWEDNCPLIMLEAQARGTPVISSNRGGPPGIRPRRRRRPHCRPDGCRLASRPASTALGSTPALRSTFGRRARERVLEVHGVEPHLVGLTQIYAEACGGPA